MTRRALTITPGWTVVDGQLDPAGAVRDTPPETWANGLGALLDRLAPRFGGEGVVVLDRAAAHALKLPTGPDESSTVGQDDARAAGWLSHSPIKSPWVTFYAEGRPTIVVGIRGWPDFRRSPLTDAPSDLDVTYRLALWHEATGSAWRGTPGVAGLTVFRATAPTYPVKGKRVHPSYKLTGPGADLAGEAYELDWEPEDWAGPWEQRYAHGYDATRMYLAAAQTCEVLAPWSLRRTGPRRFDPRKPLAGWWRVELGPWQDDRIPAPAGPGDRTRWVTTPTLALLAELQEAGGPFQTFEVLDSVTADGRRVLRDWADTLERAYQTARGHAEAQGHPFGTDQDGAAVQRAVKRAYAEAWGLLNREQSAVYRPDWHHAVLAQARANLWRKVWRVGLTEQRWPIEIKVDNVWYGSDDPDPEAARPAGLPAVNRLGLTDALGTFKVKGTRERKPR